MVRLDTGRYGQQSVWTRCPIQPLTGGAVIPPGAEKCGDEISPTDSRRSSTTSASTSGGTAPRPEGLELAKSLGLAFASAVNHHLHALERKGWLQLNPGMLPGHPDSCGRARPCSTPSELPEVAAGTPILADESKAAWRIPDDLAKRLHPQADFYVVVRGDSMSSVGYRSGDIVAVKRTPDAAEGDIVVARIGTDITLKCFHRPSDDRVELRPCSKNPEHCAIVIDEQTEDWEIVGVVVGAMIGPPR